MTPLRQRMLDYMQLKHYSPLTIKSYIAHVAYFARYIGKSPEGATLEEVANYLLYLSREKGLSQTYLNGAYSGIKVLLCDVLGRAWDRHLLPRSRREKRLPGVLSVEDALRLVNAPTNLKHRTILQLLYGTGLRMSEALALRLGDIDSTRMVIVVRQGKGYKDRYVPLTASLLDLLRQYWRFYKPKCFLFESAQTGGAMSQRTVQTVFQRARQKAGVKNEASVHTLRHCYATHLLEAGVEVMAIKTFMGQANYQLQPAIFM